MSYYSRLTGKTYESLEAMRHYEGLEAQRRNVPTAEESAFDNLPAEKVRELIEKASKSEQHKAAEVQGRIDTEAFLRAYPEYQDCDHNSAAMIFYLQGMGVSNLRAANFEQLEYAFLHLKEGGFLKLKASELKRQASDTVDDRLKEIQRSRTEFNEQDAESLSMDELRQRASRQLAGGGGVSRDGVGSMGSEHSDGARPLNSAASSVLDDPQRTYTPGSWASHRTAAVDRRF